MCKLASKASDELPSQAFFCGGRQSNGAIVFLSVVTVTDERALFSNADREVRGRKSERISM